ncbi:transporter substrate-binding domain-containing protein [Pseudoalteromonas sp. DL-6]|uniref:substrate-binding periplasmic protein n=1 Tax=Pseudoalteromonas sp. DL-6 TaxID=1390185 RepID=UPI00103CEA3C|nr:transporter substrate-binding domain-containing protein [Pseudoalteromonas sp. DL-6]QBJ62661.1 amino acid ABC transporter substrate-binding protein [Pseudoalteromonas sp. DL-6]
MRIFLVIPLLLSLFTYADPAPVTYSVDDKNITLSGEKYKSGYGYNLESDTVLRLVTLNWPPYIDDNLCNKGWLYQLTVSMLVKRGYGVHIEFYPWARAVREAELGKADILFPEYYITDDVMSENILTKTRNQLLALSEPIPGGDLSFVALKDHTIDYDGSINSVKNRVMGVVRSYKNSDELDELIDQGKIKTIVANSEYQLIHLLLNGRVELIVADLEVLKASIYKSLLSNRDKKMMLNALVALSPSIEYKALYYEISKSTANWQSILADINAEIVIMRKNNTFESFINNKKQQCYNLG